MPVVAIAPNDAPFDKLKSNRQEVRARGGELYILGDQAARISDTGEGVHVIRLCEHAAVLSPMCIPYRFSWSPTMPPCLAATTSTSRGIWLSQLLSSKARRTGLVSGNRQPTSTTCSLMRGRVEAVTTPAGAWLEGDRKIHTARRPTRSHKLRDPA